MAFMDSADYATAMSAAKKGCCDCGGAIPIPPAGAPFSGGDNRFRYRCVGCWALYWDGHPEDLADDASRHFCSEQARTIRLKRGTELLFEEGDNRVFLSDRGTLILRLKPSISCGPDEYDPERFAALIRALQAVDLKEIDGY